MELAERICQMLLLNLFSFRKVDRINRVATLFLGMFAFSTIVCPPTIM